MEKTEFIRCPVCGNKTRDKIPYLKIFLSFVQNAKVNV